MDYEVTKPFGQYKIGNIVSDSKKYIRRKITEDGNIAESRKCLKKVEKKMNINPIKNKMDNSRENKGAK